MWHHSSVDSLHLARDPVTEIISGTWIMIEMKATTTMSDPPRWWQDRSKKAARKSTRKQQQTTSQWISSIMPTSKTQFQRNYGNRSSVNKSLLQEFPHLQSERLSSNEPVLAIAMLRDTCAHKFRTVFWESICAIDLIICAEENVDCNSQMALIPKTIYSRRNKKTRKKPTIVECDKCNVIINVINDHVQWSIYANLEVQQNLRKIVIS